MAAPQQMAVFQKHFNSEIEEVVDSRTITFEQLSQHFHLPINEVAKKLGVCLTVLKKVCRKQGIPRWPYRKLKSIDKSIESLRNSAMNCPAEAHSIFHEIENLEKQKIEIRENPSILVKDPQTPESASEHSPPLAQEGGHAQPGGGRQNTLSVRSEPVKKKKSRQMTKITSSSNTRGPPSSYHSPVPEGSSSSFSIDQFGGSGGEYFDPSPLSPSPSDPFDPSPISPQSPGSPPPQNGHHKTRQNNGRVVGNKPRSSLSNSAGGGVPPVGGNNNTNHPPTPNSGRTRKRDDAASPFVTSPFSSFASPQFFGVSQPTFHLGGNNATAPAPYSPQHSFSHQLPQLEQKMRETCLGSPAPSGATVPNNNSNSAAPGAAAGGSGSVSHFSTGVGQQPIINPALLPSFRELVSFQALPANGQNYYRNQLGSVTPDIPRPSKRMRDSRSDTSSQQVAPDVFLPSLENFTPH